VRKVTLHFAGDVAPIGPEGSRMASVTVTTTHATLKHVQHGVVTGVGFFVGHTAFAPGLVVHLEDHGEVPSENR
jgi:hypothetical protein